MQAFLLSKDRLKTWEEAIFRRRTVNLTFKNSTSSISKILSHDGLVFGQGMKAKFVVRFTKNANHNLLRIATNAYQSTLHLFSVCRETIMQ